MENSSNSDENRDLGYEPSSSSMDQSEPYCSRMSNADSSAYCRTSSEISSTGFSEPPTDETSNNNNNSCSETASPWWQPRKSIHLSRVGRIRQQKDLFDDKPDDQEQTVDLLEPELEMMKRRFSKLLLGEDMSGSGKGVCTALTISNSITNLYASVFGDHTRLEPLPPEKKLTWKREMNCLLSVCDYIVEFLPTIQNLRDGTTLEVMVGMPRTDIHINLPALRKLDIMLMNILESFKETEFWYVEQGSMSANSMGRSSRSFRRIIQFQAQQQQQQQQQRKGDKWWLPLPCVPPSTGLSEVSIKHLKQKRDCAYQIHKAALTINSTIVADMEIPHPYITSLSQSGKATVGERIYRHMNNAEKFYPEELLESLNINSEHEALELADRLEASMYIWRHKACISHSKSSWEMVKDFMSDIHDKNRRLAERAEVLLCCLKQRNPELPQTSLETSKIQYNRDAGQAILESYSRVLEGLAFNIVAWIDDVLFVDKSIKNQR